MTKIKVCLDAGHYGKYNRSPAIKTYYESEMNWKLHLLLKDELEAYGIEVVLTRENQKKDLSLITRGKASKGCDLFLSIHSNAVGSKVDESVDYPVAYVSINGKGYKLGELLADCVEKVMGTKQNGRISSRKGTWGNYDYYTVIKGATDVGVVGIILEHSFHTNTKSTKWLLDDANLAKMAKAEADVIAEYFGVKKPSSTGTSEKKPVAEEPAAKANTVLEWQKAAMADGFTFPKYGADGKWGSESEKVAKKAIVKKRSTYQYKNLTKIVQKAVGVEADGLCGTNTKNAIIAYQKKHKLTADGAVGLNTWKKILGV
jgi:N-acetylmuramoyl-L-alanine amidase